MKKEREKQANSALFEGMTSLRAVLYAMDEGISNRKIIRVFLDESKKGKKNLEFSFIEAMKIKHGFITEYVSRETIEKMSIGTSHGGVVFSCTDRDVPSLCSEDLISDGFYVMIEGIEDPYNFGYAIRSIYAAGADGIVLSPRNWLSAAGIVCRSSAGTSERIRGYTTEGVDAVEIFHQAGYKTVCAGIRNSVSAFDADLKKPLFLIIGGERRGISANLLSVCDQIVRLDYGRDFAGSLSSSSAASILSYEVLRQNRK